MKLLEEGKEIQNKRLERAVNLVKDFADDQQVVSRFSPTIGLDDSHQRGEVKLAWSEGKSRRNKQKLRKCSGFRTRERSH